MTRPYMANEPSDAMEYEELLEAARWMWHEVNRLNGVVIMLDSDNYELRNDTKDMQLFVAENAKLRKLIQDLDECAGNVPPCDSGCAHWDGGACDCSLHILDRVRELEMEVPM